MSPGDSKTTVIPHQHRPFNVAHIAELVLEVLQHADSASLLTCEAVSSIFREYAVKLFESRWSDEGFITVLDELGCYENKIIHALQHRRITDLHGSPSFADWNRLRQSIGPFIKHLTWDTKSQAISAKSITLLLSAAPYSISLPFLDTLQIAVNEDDDELELASRFFTPSVKTFIAHVWEPLPHDARATHIAKRNKSSHIPSPRPLGDAISGSQLLLQEFLRNVSYRMPALTELSIQVRDVLQLRVPWITLMLTLWKLTKLQTLKLPPYAVPPRLLWMICDHCALQRIVAVEDPAVPPLYLRDEPATVVVPDLLGIGRHIPSTLTTLSVVMDCASIAHFFGRTVQINNIKRLHLYIIDRVPKKMEVSSIFAHIAQACPELYEFKIGPLTSYDGQEIVLTQGDKALQPLFHCNRLLAIDVLTYHTNDEKGLQRLPNWPSPYRRIQLDRTTRSSPQPIQLARFSSRFGDLMAHTNVE